MRDAHPMLGLALEPTIALRRGEAYVAQCQSCGCLLAVSSLGGREPHQLGTCPACNHRAWTPQHVPVGPVTAEWAHQVVGAAVAVADSPTAERLAAFVQEAAPARVQYS